MTAKVEPIRWERDHLRLLDQRVLPLQERYVECRTPEEVAIAIHQMVVRGAPAIGIAAAYGLVLAAQRGESYDEAEAVLARSRPTAVNLRWALQRMRGVWQKTPSADALLADAKKIHEEDLAQNLKMAELGAALLPKHAGKKARRPSRRRQGRSCATERHR